MYTSPLYAASPRRSSCNSCALKDLCLPCGLNVREIDLLEKAIAYRSRFKRGDFVCRTGQKFEGLYAIRLGFLKSSLSTDEGHEQVIDFFMSGDVIGWEGIANGVYATDVVALEDVDACFISYQKLLELMPQQPPLITHVQKLLSREIIHKQGALLLLGSLRAEERLAAFLIRLSQRFEQRGYSRSEFVLRMTRAEIGSYLGLKLETVSRVLSHFTHNNIISVTQKHVQILNFDALTKIVSGTKEPYEDGESFEEQTQATTGTS